MKLIVGLGNPEIKYKYTRHNTGFLMMDKILERHKIILSDKFNSFFAKSKDVLYLLPKTYMNLSGDAVIQVLNFYKLKNTDIMVIYDDATIKFGTFRIKKSGSFGGHNGIKSIINKLGTEDFARLKIGVGPVPESISIDSFVLNNFSDEELKLVDKMGYIAADAIDCWINEGLGIAQNKYNGLVI